MVTLTSEREFISLFTIPFKPKKILYSLNSDFFKHGNISYNFGEKQLAIEIDDEELLHNPLPEFPCGEHGCKELFTIVHDYEMHYRSAHSIVCNECKKSFPSYNLLDIHIQERHDTYFDTAKDRNIPVFNCFVDGCDIKFSTLDMRNEHAIKAHNYPPNFKFQNLKTQKVDEKMDASSSEEHRPVSSSKPHHRKPVPYNICFGRGSPRTFARKKKSKSPRDITMKELADALN